MTSTELVGPASHYRQCSSGRHWGPDGAAGALCWAVARDEQPHVLLSRRSRHVQQGGCWAFPGGAIDEGESPWQAAARETAEEVRGLDVSTGTITAELEAPSPAGCSWSYTTYLVRVPLHASGRLPRVRVLVVIPRGRRPGWRGCRSSRYRTASCTPACELRGRNCAAD